MLNFATEGKKNTVSVILLLSYVKKWEVQEGWKQVIWSTTEQLVAVCLFCCLQVETGWAAWGCWQAQVLLSQAGEINTWWVTLGWWFCFMCLWHHQRIQFHWNRHFKCYPWYDIFCFLCYICFLLCWRCCWIMCSTLFIDHSQCVRCCVKELNTVAFMFCQKIVSIGGCASWFSFGRKTLERMRCGDKLCSCCKCVATQCIRLCLHKAPCSEQICWIHSRYVISVCGRYACQRNIHIHMF